MMHPLCLLRSIWRSLICRAPVSGHDFQTDPEPTPENVHVFTCMTCGERHVLWSWESIEHTK